MRRIIFDPRVVLFTLHFSRPPSVTAQPEAMVLCWRFYQVQDVRMALVGRMLETGRPRVTSPIVRLDPVRRLATTLSGRLYHLEGFPGAPDELFRTAIEAQYGPAADITERVCTRLGIPLCAPSH